MTLQSSVLNQPLIKLSRSMKERYYDSTIGKTIRLSKDYLFPLTLFGFLSLLLGTLFLKTPISIDSLILFTLFLFSFLAFMQFFAPFSHIYNLEYDIAKLSDATKLWTRKDVSLDNICFFLNDFRFRLIKLRKYYRTTFSLEYRNSSTVIDEINTWYLTLSHLLTAKQYREFIEGVHGSIIDENGNNSTIDLAQLESWMKEFDAYLFIKKEKSVISPIVLININEIIQEWNDYLRINHPKVYEKYVPRISDNTKNQLSARSLRANFWSYVFPALIPLIVAFLPFIGDIIDVVMSKI